MINKKMLLAAIVLLCSATLNAQRRVSGIVLDPNHAPIKGATVFVTYPGGSLEGSYTDEKGKFNIRLKRPGTAVVTSLAPLFKTMQIIDFRVRTRKLRIVMEAGGITDEAIRPRGKTECRHILFFKWDCVDVYELHGP